MIISETACYRLSMLGLEYKEWQMCHNLKERRTAVDCTRVVWELGIWEWAMGIGSDSGVGMSSRAQTGWQNRTVEAEALVAVRSDYVSKAANLVLSLVFEGEETGYDIRLQPHAWVHRHTHSCVREAWPFWYGMAYTPTYCTNRKYFTANLVELKCTY